MKKITAAFLLSHGFVFSTSILVHAAAVGNEVWKLEMQKMKAALTEILPFAAKIDSYNAPENALIIQGHIKSMISTAKNLNHFQGKVSVANDPTVEFVAASFENNLKSIEESNLRGRRDYARFLVLNTTSYCIECHTRTNSGPQFVGVQTDEFVGKLNSVERVEYLISVRQFQEALNVINDEIKKNSGQPLFGAEKLIRYGLTVTIKYFDDPSAGLKIVETSRKAKNLPFYLKSDLENWKNSLREWQKEKKPKAELKLNEKIKRTKELITKASEMNRKTQTLHAGDVHILRANAMLLSLFKEQMAPIEQQKILYLVGESYRQLPEHLFWTLHESYFEACIKVGPHSQQAEQCYNSFEESTLLGYSGSSATNLPIEITKRLRELKDLATVKKTNEEETGKILK